jgi:hypothetical protein
MKRKLTINEELNRMKDLMSYENGHYKNPIISEQETITEDCVTISHKGSFGVSETAGSGAFTEFLNKIKETISSNPKLKEKSEKGVVYVTEFKLIGGASNYHTGNSVEPDFNNDGVTPYNGTNKYNKDKSSTNYTKNQELAVNRAKNLATKLGEKGGLDSIGVVYDKGTLENALTNTKGYVIDTGGTNDKSETSWSSGGKTYEPGQIVKIDMTICYQSKDTTEDIPEIETGSTEVVVIEQIPEILKTCFNDVTIEVIYDDKGHSCNHAIYEIYANGFLLQRNTDGNIYPYASLNNTKGFMDNAEVLGSNPKHRRNVFTLKVDGINKEFFNENVIGKHNGKLVISAACKRTKRKDGSSISPEKWKSSSDCHEGVGRIIVTVPSLNKTDEEVVETPNTFDKVVELSTFPACELIVKHVTEGKPKVIQKIKIWWQKLKKKREDKKFEKGENGHWEKGVWVRD